jgi:hypothetical protein
VQLVADANVLLSAVIGGRAALALRHEKVEQVFTPSTAYDEVFEYLPSLAKKKRLELDTLLLVCGSSCHSGGTIGVRSQALHGETPHRQARS